MNASKFLLLLILIVSINACNNTSDEDKTFKTLSESLTASIKATENINNIYLQSLDSKLHDFETHDQAAIWNPKALKVKERTDSFCGLLNTLKSRLKQGTSVSQINENGSFEDVFRKAELLKDSLGIIDNDLAQLFTKLPIITLEFDISSNKDFYAYFFKNKSIESAIAILNAFENNTRIIEQQVLRFCDLKSRSIVDGYEEFATAIVSQSTSYIQAGEKIEINAGIGCFSRATQPKVIINGRMVELNDWGVATTIIKGSSKPGKHSIPVSLEFTKPDGQKATLQKTTEYTVAE